MKKITLLSLVLFVITLSAVSCQKEKPYRDGDRTIVPFRLRTVLTRVSYAENGLGQNEYAFKSGDKLAISSTVRPDISGVLSYDGSSAWTGYVSYLTDAGEPAETTALKATLIHADNIDQSTYANGIASELQEAVEKYSLFTDDITFESTTATLEQQACFLTTTVTFNFENGNFNLAGETSVDVIVNNSLTVSGRAVLAQVGQTNSYSSTFVIAMPGGTTLTDESVIQICDRDVQLVNEDKTLAANTKYTVSRSIDFKPQLGDPFWSDGSYGRIAHNNGATITGIIVFVNNYEDSDNSDLAKQARALTEKEYGYGHALVMSLRNAASAVKWRSDSSQQKNSTTYITTPAQTLDTANVSGYHNSDLLAGCTAVDYALNYRSGDAHTGNDSGWFLPSIGQWIYSISTRGFGGADPVETWTATDNKNWITKGSLSNLVGVMKSTSSENALVLSLNNRLEVLKNDFGCDYDAFGMSSGTYYGDNYWSSSENTASNAIRMNFGSMETINGQLYSTIKTAGISKGNTAPNSPYDFCVMKVRPFLAF